MARLLPFTRTQAYGASKAALHYFTKSLEVDLHHKGVKVQAVSPGFVETPLTDKNDFEMPMKISAEEAADAMLKGIEATTNSFLPSVLWFYSALYAYTANPTAKRLSLAMREKQ